MILFESRDQFLLTPAIGFVRDGQTLCVTLAWFWYGVSFKICEIK